MPANGNPTQAHVLILRTCAADLTSNSGKMKWPESGSVSAPDWDPSPACGQGLHGFLWGEGNGELADWSPDAKWLVVRVPADTIVDLNGKVKFPAAEVVHCGDRISATQYLHANGGAGRPIIGGEQTAGLDQVAIAGYRGSATVSDRGIATAGYRGTATAGDYGTAVAGDRGTAAAGDYGTAMTGDYGVATVGLHGTAKAGDGGTATAGECGTARVGMDGTAITGDCGTAVTSTRGSATAGVAGTATAGYRGTAKAGKGGVATAGDEGSATAGEGGVAIAGGGGTAAAGTGGVISITYSNGWFFQAKVGAIKDRSGKGALEPDTPYRLDANGEWVVASPQDKGQ